MGVAERLEAKRKQQEATRARNETEASVPSLRDRIGSQEALQRFADFLDKHAKDSPGTTWGRFQRRLAEGINTDRDWATSNSDSAACTGCAGTGWRNVSIPGHPRPGQGLAQCHQCGYWGDAISAGIGKAAGDRDYANRVRRRARGERFEGSSSVRNTVAERIVASMPAAPKKGGKGKLESFDDFAGLIEVD